MAAALFLAMFVGNIGIASAETASSTLVSQIQSLLQQVKSLQDQMNGLNTQLKEALQLTRSLSLGMTSDDVKMLQEVLASDPSIYPEGLVTGYYGSLTEKAVKKFQAKFGIEQAGRVGPKTLAKLNALLKEGKFSRNSNGKAGVATTTVSSEEESNNDSNGGFKIAICHKPGGNLANAHTITVGAPALTAHMAHGDSLGACSGTSNNSTASTTPDTTAPIISNLASSNATTTAYISWTTNELATSTLWYSSTTPVSTSTATTMGNSSWKTNHSYSLTGLTATTTYYYILKVSDAAGNSVTNTEHSFKTLDN